MIGTAVDRMLYHRGRERAVGVEARIFREIPRGSRRGLGQ
jgi:hypothetical protein